MKAIITIELEMDGKWKATDREKLMEMILEHPEHAIWFVDHDRLNVMAKYSEICLKKSRTKP